MGWLITFFYAAKLEHWKVRVEVKKICGYLREPFLQEQAPLNVGRRRVCFGSDGIGQHQYWPPTAIFVCQHLWWILWTDIGNPVRSISGGSKIISREVKGSQIGDPTVIYGDLYTPKIERWKVNPEDRSRWSRVDKGRRFLALHDLILGIVSLETFFKTPQTSINWQFVPEKMMMRIPKKRWACYFSLKSQWYFCSGYRSISHTRRLWCRTCATLVPWSEIQNEPLNL